MWMLACSQDSQCLDRMHELVHTEPTTCQVPSLHKIGDERMSKERNQSCQSRIDTTIEGGGVCQRKFDKPSKEKEDKFSENSTHLE